MRVTGVSQGDRFANGLVTSVMRSSSTDTVTIFVSYRTGVEEWYRITHASQRDVLGAYDEVGFTWLLTDEGAAMAHKRKMAYRPTSAPH